MSVLRRYYRGATLTTMRDDVAQESRVYHFDHQGTTQCLTNAQGQVTDRFASDAWGVQVKRTGSSINRHWYVGDRGYQAATFGTYVRHRHLVSRLGCWLSVDAVPGQRPYSYPSSPALLSDPSGRIKMDPRCDKCGSVGATIKAADQSICKTLDDPAVARCFAPAAGLKVPFDSIQKCIRKWCDAPADDPRIYPIQCISDPKEIPESWPGGKPPCATTPQTIECEPTCAEKRKKIRVNAPPICATTPTNNTNPPVPDPTGPIVFCCWWYVEFPKVCKIGTAKDIQCDPASKILIHELVHLCTGIGHAQGEAVLQTVIDCLHSGPWKEKK